jgi:hypothetical protein
MNGFKVDHKQIHLQGSVSIKAESEVTAKNTYHEV